MNLHQSADPSDIKMLPIFFLEPIPGLIFGLDRSNNGIKYLVNSIIYFKEVGVAFIIKLEIYASTTLLKIFR